MLENEKRLLKSGYSKIAGIDEAGRGPIAGPVVAAAVILKPHFSYQYITDSKKMTEKQRNIAYHDIMENAMSVGIGIIDNDEIDRINILEATKKAMKQALTNMHVSADYVLIDAVKLDLTIGNESIIKGDQKSLSIAAASVIAKVTRDQIMAEYDKMYPEFEFSKHKGYPTKKHQEIVLKIGPCPIHRKTFAPIKSMKLQK